MSVCSDNSDTFFRKCTWLVYLTWTTPSFSKRYAANLQGKRVCNTGLANKAAAKDIRLRADTNGVVIIDLSKRCKSASDWTDKHLAVLIGQIEGSYRDIWLRQIPCR